jgi:hypothetical protein
MSEIKELYELALVAIEDGETMKELHERLGTIYQAGEARQDSAIVQQVEAVWSLAQELHRQKEQVKEASGLALEGLELTLETTAQRLANLMEAIEEIDQSHPMVADLVERIEIDFVDGAEEMIYDNATEMLHENLMERLTILMMDVGIGGEDAKKGAVALHDLIEGNITMSEEERDALQRFVRGIMGNA